MNPITRLAQLKGTRQEQSRQSPTECPLIESSNADDQMHFTPFRQENCDTKKPESTGTFRTDSGLFGIVLIGTILIIGALLFLPMAVLGPLAEQLGAG